MVRLYLNAVFGGRAILQKLEKIMATIYHYDTRKIERDFHFAQFNEPCRLTQLPCRVGSTWCHKCEHNAGIIHSWQLPGDESYVMCKHPDMPDSPYCAEAEALFNESFEVRALSIL